MSAIKNKDSFFGSLDNSIAGIIAPKRFPKCGIPLLCIPVKILAIVFCLKSETVKIAKALISF
jgi:hypothetical protein